MYTLEVGKKMPSQEERTPSLPHTPPLGFHFTASHSLRGRWYPKGIPPSSSKQVLPVGTQSWAQGRQQAGACAAGDGQGELDV